MEISSTCLSSVSTSIPRVPPPSLPFCSSNSTFFTSNATISFFNKTKPNNNTLVLGPTKTRSRVERARKGLTCNALFGLGVPELAVIAGVAALVFGPKKLPEVGRSIGKTVKSFQQAAKEFESELKKEPDSITEPPVDKPTAVSEEEKPDIKVSSTKESAAKEFESELKEKPDSITEPPADKPTAVSEEEKPDIKVSSTKESV